MATNPYFRNFDTSSEQNLQNDLIIESIRIYGHDFVYLPRHHMNKDLIYGEDVLSFFQDSYEMEMWIASVEEFGGDGELFSKFGSEIRDQAELVCAMSVFVDATDHIMERPLEGDLIYFPMTDGLFEIHRVEADSIFFQLGSLYVFKLTIEQYEYSHEELNTGYESIDRFEDENTYALNIELAAGTGTFEVDEVVYQGADEASATAKAEVLEWDTGTSTLRVKNIVGVFNISDALVGATSGASYALAAEPDTQEIPQEEYADNKRLETEADAIFVFSERDPFSEGDY